MLTLTKRYMIEPPLFLPLASRCFALMAQSIPAEAATAFRQRMSDRLLRAGAGLERHFAAARTRAAACSSCAIPMR